ncbi:hypothetical protein LOD99_11799 [Oopsacas minuta]|uniref:Uncharacterized protein n=1 Tax=Oopsacas minuta TaxID=111878 RepID=A0AAV7JLY3_9METZ|nr:hypothetical protein LOD99_11799 [Oopsacas minuta]
MDAKLINNLNNISLMQDYYFAIARANYYLFCFNIYAQFFHFVILAICLVYACFALKRVLKFIKAGTNSDCDPSILSNHTNRKYELILFLIIALIELVYFLLNLFLTLFVAIYDEPIRNHPSYLKFTGNCTLARGSAVGEAYDPGLDNFVYINISPIYSALLLLLVWVLYLSIWRKNLVLMQSLLYQQFGVSELKIYQFIPVGIIQGVIFVFLNFHPLTLLASHPIFCLFFQFNLVMIYREYRRFCDRYNQWIIELKRDNEYIHLKRARYQLKSYKVLFPTIWWTCQFYFLRYLIYTIHMWVETIVSNTCFFQAYGINVHISLSETEADVYQMLQHITLFVIQLMRSLFYLLLAAIYVVVLIVNAFRIWKFRRPIPRYRLGIGNNVIRTY